MLKIAPVLLGLVAALAWGQEANMTASAEVSAQLKAQDAELNAAYKAAMATCDAQLQEFLRKGERAWIRYRDALAEVAVLRDSEREGSPELAKQKSLLSETTRRTDYLKTLFKKYIDNAELHHPCRSPEEAEKMLKKVRGKCASTLDELAFSEWVREVGQDSEGAGERIRKALQGFLDATFLFRVLVVEEGDFEGRYVDLSSENQAALSFVPSTEPPACAECKINVSTRDAPVAPNDKTRFRSMTSSLELPGLREPLKVAEGQETTYEDGHTESYDSNVESVSWLVPGKVLWVRIVEHIPGQGLITEQVDTIFEIKDGVARKKFESRTDTSGKSGKSYYWFGHREYRWDKPAQRLVEIELSESESSCDPKDFLAGDWMFETYQRVVMLDRRTFDISKEGDPEKLKPEKVVRAISLQDVEVEPEALANFVALSKSGKSTVSPVGTVPSKAVHEALEKLKRLNPGLKNEPRWCGVIYLP